MKVAVHFLDNTDYGEHEAIQKELRVDVFVVIDGKYYHPIIMTPLRLRQECEAIYPHYGFYLIENDLIFAKETSRDEVVKTIRGLSGRRYFDGVKTMSEGIPDLDEKTLVEEFSL